jgi:hypothetical protein
MSQENLEPTFWWIPIIGIIRTHHLLTKYRATIWRNDYKDRRKLAVLFSAVVVVVGLFGSIYLS